MAAATMNTEQARFNMIQQQIRPWEVLDPEVLGLLTIVKREDFAPAAHKDLAFADVEVPLKKDAKPSQTMLAPRIEARMLQALGIRNTDKVLEIGAGSGFMAALLAAKAEFVYTVEIDPELVELARKNLAQAGVANVSVDLGDGAQGWSLYAPYDAIVVSASTPVLPDALRRQLKIGGRLIAIVGDEPVMRARLVRRADDSAWSQTDLFDTVAPRLRGFPESERFSF